jgi:hypothetical protein
MEFIASHWWLWLVLGIGSVIFFFASGIFRVIKTKKKIDGAKTNTETEKTVTKAVGVTLGQLVLTGIVASSCWLLFIISLVTNLIKYIVHLAK